jgi:hypothetical protein
MTPGGRDAQRAAAVLVSVVPSGGSTAVPAGTAVTLRFSEAMAAAMEQYVDLHAGALSGPVVPMGCAWSPDRATLTCTPRAPLPPRTPHVIHVGGGLTTAGGRPLECDPDRPGLGGQWAMPDGMGPHGGMPPGMMGPGWRHPNGGYGMQFAFVTD